MKTIKLKDWSEVPENFTGKIEYENGDASYLLNGKEHRLDGPAETWVDYPGEYWINGHYISSNEQEFYNSKLYVQYILLENLKKIKNIHSETT